MNGLCNDPSCFDCQPKQLGQDRMRLDATTERFIELSFKVGQLEGEVSSLARDCSRKGRRIEDLENENRELRRSKEYAERNYAQAEAYAAKLEKKIPKKKPVKKGKK